MLNEKYLNHDPLAEFAVLKDTVYKQGLEIDGLKQTATSYEENKHDQELLIKNIQKDNFELKGIIEGQEKKIMDMNEQISELQTTNSRRQVTEIEETTGKRYKSINKMDKQQELMHDYLSYQNNGTENLEQLQNQDISKDLKDGGINSKEHSAVEENEAFNAKTGKNGQHSSKYYQALSKVRGRSIANRQIAFSAYLDNIYRQLSTGHVIKCNRALANSGNHYNAYTGVFSVPTSGFYFLTFFINGWGKAHQTYVSMVVNKRNIVDAVSIPTHMDQMGGNAAIIHSNAGESVWLEVFGTSTGQAVSDETYRYVTFSGIFLF